MKEALFDQRNNSIWTYVYVRTNVFIDTAVSDVLSVVFVSTDSLRFGHYFSLLCKEIYSYLICRQQHCYIPYILGCKSKMLGHNKSIFYSTRHLRGFLPLQIVVFFLFMHVKPFKNSSKVCKNNSFEHE